MNRSLTPAGMLAFATVFLLAGANPGLCSQATGSGGTIQGTVTDPTGAVIAGAEVKLTNSVTGYKQTVNSGPDGSFRLVNIPPNQYHLEITNPGFQTYTQDLPVRTQVPIPVKASLALAGATETVTVSASAEVLENVPSGHTDVSQGLLANLPIASTGQGLSDAITLTSGGVVADSNGFFHPQGDHGETTYVVDGQSISDQQSKTFSTQLPPNAFQSLELVSSAPSAEYGDKTGLIVNTVTRSGLGQKAERQSRSELWLFRHHRRTGHLRNRGSEVGQFPRRELQQNRAIFRHPGVHSISRQRKQ